MTSDAWPAPLPFLPRTDEARCDRADCLMLLERERLLAAALALRGVARAWDSGLLGEQRVEGAPPYEREVLALIGATQGLTPERVTEADGAVQEAMKARREIDEHTRGKVRPIDLLTSDFDLDGLARMVLMLVAAPRFWGEVAQLYGILASGPHRPTVDEHLLRLLLGYRVNLHDLATVLDPDQPLVRAGLIHVGDGERPFAGYAVDPLVVHRLRGDALDHDPEGVLDVLDASRTLDELRLAPMVVEAVRAWSTRTTATPARLVVRARPGAGRRTLLAALARAAGRRLAMVKVDQLADLERGGTAALSRALIRCRLAGWVPCLDGFELLPDDERLRDRVRHVLDSFPGPLTMRLGRDARPLLAPGYTQLDLPELSESERLAVWSDALGARDLDAAATAALAARWRIGAGTIHRVVTGLEAPAASGGDGGGLNTAIDRAVSQHLEQRLGDVAERIRTLPRLTDMVLPPDIEDSLTEFLSRMRLNRKVFEEWGMTRVATSARGLTALFQGPPGTGKTMVAGALAHELGLDLYRVDLSRVMSKWIGETEQNLASVFAAAEESQAIILFDEADSLFTKRTEVKSSTDRFANLEVNYLLQRLDTFVGVAILTTNLSTGIDAAFKRRLSFRITFPVPDEEQRERLWHAHLPPEIPRGERLDLAELARKYELAGGSIRNCAVRAAFLAAAEQQALTQDHLRRAIRLEYRSAGKLTDSGTIE